MSDAWIPFHPAIERPSKGWLEGMAVLEPVLGHEAGRNRNVLLLATGIGKAQVDELDFLVLDSLDHIGHGHAESPQTE